MPPQQIPLTTWIQNKTYRGPHWTESLDGTTGGHAFIHRACKGEGCDECFNGAFTYTQLREQYEAEAAADRERWSKWQGVE